MAADHLSPLGVGRAAAAALIYLLTPELMGDRAGRGPGWKEKEGGEKCRGDFQWRGE